MNPVPRECLEIVEIKVEVRPGTTEVEAMKAAITLAVREWKDVRVRFNGRDMVISVESFLKAVQFTNV